MPIFDAFAIGQPGFKQFRYELHNLIRINFQGHCQHGNMRATMKHRQTLHHLPRLRR